MLLTASFILFITVFNAYQFLAGAVLMEAPWKQWSAATILIFTINKISNTFSRAHTRMRKFAKLKGNKY